jgi:predicted transcriptional regulator
MAILHAADDALSPAEVRARLGQDLAYTTVMTVLSRLFAKGLLTRRRGGRAFLYRPADDAQVAAHGMHRLLEAGPDRAAVLRQFVDTLSAGEEQLLIDLLARASDDGDSS